jgi:hypothetical protein
MPKPYNPDKAGMTAIDALNQYAKDNEQFIIARSLSTQFQNIAAGGWSEAFIVWEGSGSKIWAALIRYIQVVKTGGAATSFDFRILAIEGGVETDITYEYLNATDRIDVAHDPAIPYHNDTPFTDPDDKKYKVICAIYPTGGAGSFKVKLTANRRR